MTMTTEWTPERLEKLTLFWRMGFGASAIAEHLGGVSRNAVIGKAKRIGLPQSTIEDRLIRLSQAISENIDGAPVVGVDPATLYTRDDRHHSPAAPRRDGQSRFRQNVLERYSACVVTGCTTELALQAAHIIPYAQSRSQDPERGVLLRADIHSLFDAGLISIAPLSYRVLVSANLASSDYNSLAGLRACFASQKPRDADLAWHVANIFQAP